MANRPNFLFILADDLGYADLGCYGGRLDCSPNLDQLAREGTRFTSAYANSSVCSPSRFALATGRYQHRLHGGFDEPLHGPSSANKGLPPEVPTVASLLRDAGYATALVGKWHMGALPRFGPLQSGYQEFFGHRAGAADYFKHGVGGNHDLWDGDEKVKVKGHLTDLFTQRAIDFVRRTGSKRPFLLSLHYNAPHWPWETRNDEAESKRITNIAHLDGGSVHTYAAMIREMDEGIGKLLSVLNQVGASDDTIVVFTSDNGGERFSDNWPLVGGKMDLTEGGIRVPWIAHWPAGIPAGATSGQLCMSMDWSATLLEIGGGRPHPDYPIDGVSLAKVLHDPSQCIERPLYWRMNHRHQRALRKGDWKYLKVDGNEYLFNLARDARERANLAHRHPDRFEQLRAEWQAWEQTVPPVPEDAGVSLGYSAKDMPQR